MTTSTTRMLRLRYRAVCRTCGADLEAGTQAEWDRVAKSARCMPCAAAEPTAPLESVAGRSARGEAERRRARQAARLQAEREARPILGRLRQGFFPERDLGRQWEKGAIGEETLAASLNPLVESGEIEALHDRRIPGSRANIDHLVIAAGGVWIIDAKRYKGRIRQDVKGGWLNARRVITVDGRDRTKLVDGLTKQHEAVVEALTAADLTEIPVHDALCFVDGDWGLRRRPFTIGEVLVTWPKALRDRVTQDGPLDEIERGRLRLVLATALPEAR